MKQITKDPQVSGVGAVIQLGRVLKGDCLLCTSLSHGKSPSNPPFGKLCVGTFHPHRRVAFLQVN